MWGMIERGVKSSAKRSMSLEDFIERLKPRLSCAAISPRYMDTDPGTLTSVITETGEIIEKADHGRRTFWVELLEEIEAEAVLESLYRNTSKTIALVRDRLEREKKLVEAGFIEEEESV